MVNKKGLAPTVIILFLVFAALAIGIGGIVFSYAMGEVEEAFSSVDVTVGQVSFQESYEQNLKPSLENAEGTAPLMGGLGLLLGMIILMMITAYMTPEKNRIWILFDVFIIIGAFMLAVIMSSSFQTFLETLPEFTAIASGDLSLPSLFVLRLYLIVPVVGGIVMFITYGLKGLKPKETEEQEVLGY